MYKYFQFYFLVLCLCLIKTVVCQECFESGKKCVDHWQCCGGCCFTGVCIDSTRDCTDMSDLCMIHYCPPGTECMLFKPPHCVECDKQPHCVEYKMPKKQ